MSNKVVHFIDTAEFGGAEQTVLNLLADLDRNCWEPVLFCHSDVGLAKFRERAEELGVIVRTVPRLQGRAAGSIHVARARELMDAITGLPHFFFELRKQRPLVFHAHLNWPLACKWGLLAAAAAHVPAIVATLQLFPQLPFRRAARIQYRVLASIVDRFIAVSDDMAHRLREELPIPQDKINVVHNAVPGPVRKDVSIGSPARTGDRRASCAPPIVFTAARLHEQKGHRYLLEAAVRVPKAVFLLAGEGPERKKLEEQSAALGISNRVEFLGRRDDVAALLDSCDIFVFPSLFEGLPLAVLEAMSAGKPVIASAIGGITEIITNGENGILVPPGNPNLLAQAIESLLNDRKLAGRLATAGLARARDFSTDALASRMSAIYDDILKERDTC